MTDSDYCETYCPKCGILHWIPESLWETMFQTRNDRNPKNAYCPYGHSYVLTADEKEEDGRTPPPEPVKKRKPRRFWQKKGKDNNVIQLKR